VDESHPEPSNSPSNGTPLSSREAVEFTGRIAELAGAGLPLAPGLRAAAAELPDDGLAAAMKRAAAALEQGKSLEQVLSAERGNLPAELAALVATGVRTGDLGRVLSEYVRLRRTLDDVRRKVWLALAYPGLLTIGAAALCFFFFVFVIPAMAATVKTIAWNLGDPSSPPPRSVLETGVEASQWVSRHAAGLVVAAAAVVAAIVLAALVAGPRRRQTVMKRLPLLGALWRHSGLIEATQLLRMLLEYDVPLPEALRLTADGIRDADVAAAIRRVATRVEAGSSLAVASSPAFPPLWRPILAWGEQHSTLPAALETGMQATMRRLDQRAELISAIVPPAVFLVVTGLFLFTIGQVGQVLEVIVSLMVIPRSRSSTAAPPIEWPAPNLSGAASLLIVGCAILVALRLVYSQRKPLADGLEIMMRLAGWLLLALGVLGVLHVFTGEWAWFVWVAALVCWGMAVFRLRELQRFELLELLALSADRQMPLEPAVRAMAEEEGGLFYSRATRLADALAAGTALAPAIERNPRALPPASSLAAKVGEVTGNVAGALRAIDAARSRPASIAGNPPIRAISLVYLLAWGGFVATFMAFKIAPAMQKIYKDFHRPLPPIASYVFAACDSIWLAVLSVVTLFLGVAVGLYAVVRRLGWLRIELPPASWFFAPREAAIVLRLLALAVDRGQPIGPLLEYLATEYPSGLIRKRARATAAGIARGDDWSASLRRAKLVRRTDAAILGAAERAGNLSWALREAASNLERRLNYRLSLLARVALPLLILTTGAAVMMFVVGFFMPLVELIASLAQTGGK
jgi:type II secretory pathway component PulF